MDQCLNSNRISASQLYEDCTSEDSQTQSQGYENLWRYLYTAARYLVDNSDDTQYLAQITLTRVFEKIDQVIEPNAFKGWARQILCNKHKNWLRKQSWHKEISPDLPSDDEFPDINSNAAIEYLFNASQGRKTKWAWIGRYYYGLHDSELADIESLLCKKQVSESTFSVARSKTKTQWIEMKLIDKLIKARFQPTDPTDPNRELKNLILQLLVAEDWSPLYEAPLDEGSRWAWIGRHIYEMSNEDLVRVENLLCQTSVGSKIMVARRSRSRENLKRYLLSMLRNL